MCTWSTDCRLDASLLQIRNSVDSALNVLHEDIPVQVKQAESKFIRHLEKNTNEMWLDPVVVLGGAW